MNKLSRYKALGRLKAKKLYPIPDVLCKCGLVQVSDIHHIDGDTHNNNPINIAFLCHKCHLRIERQTRRVGNHTKLTNDDIARIKDKRYSISKLAQEFGMDHSYLRRIRNGIKNPIPYIPDAVPDGWEYKDIRGKPRALTQDELNILWSYPILGGKNAEKYAKQFGVAISTIYKAYKRHGCYA